MQTGLGLELSRLENYSYYEKVILKNLRSRDTRIITKEKTYPRPRDCEAREEIESILRSGGKIRLEKRGTVKTMDHSRVFSKEGDGGYASGLGFEEQLAGPFEHLTAKDTVLGIGGKEKKKLGLLLARCVPTVGEERRPLFFFRKELKRESEKVDGRARAGQKGKEGRAREGKKNGKGGERAENRQRIRFKGCFSLTPFQKTNGHKKLISDLMPESLIVQKMLYRKAGEKRTGSSFNEDFENRKRLYVDTSTE